jgi:LmbE family N-acetylglucosaminyl deacetylase
MDNDTPIAQHGPRLLPPEILSARLRTLAAGPVPRVLAVVAHPDDVEALCGGLIAALGAAGAAIGYVLLTSGDKGSPDPDVDPLALAAVREAEQLAAAAVLGVADVTFLRYRDGEVTDDGPTREAVAAQIRRFRPDLLIAFDPWHAYAFHNDHRQAGLVALAAARALAPRPGPARGADGALIADVAPGHVTREAWLFLTDRPDVIVDIAPGIELKIAARIAHACQAVDAAAVALGIRTRAETSGAPYAVPLAETFRTAPFPCDESFIARLVAGEW